MEKQTFVRLPFFDSILQFPVVKIISKTDTHTTLLFIGWGDTRETTVPNDWVVLVG